MKELEYNIQGIVVNDNYNLILENLNELDLGDSLKVKGFPNRKYLMSIGRLTLEQRGCELKGEALRDYEFIIDEVDLTLKVTRRS